MNSSRCWAPGRHFAFVFRRMPICYRVNPPPIAIDISRQACPKSANQLKLRNLAVLEKPLQQIDTLLTATQSPPKGPAEVRKTLAEVAKLCAAANQIADQYRVARQRVDAVAAHLKQAGEKCQESPLLLLELKDLCKHLALAGEVLCTGDLVGKDAWRAGGGAVVGRAHELKGQAISAFVILKEGNPASPDLAAELKEHVVRKIGAIARPEDVLFAADLPKTRSGKIMRRLLKDIAEGKTLGDTTTLADPAVVAKLKEEYQEDAG